MFDILPFVSEVLAETGAQIELAENDFSATLPLIAMQETSNISVVITDASEQVSEISIQLDLYDATPEKVKNLSGVVSSLMIAHGFRRGAGQLMKEDNLWRDMQQYSCYITASRRIYSGDNYV